MADLGEQITFGRGVRIRRLGLGTGPLGNLYAPLTDAAAEATLASAWDLGIRFFDTAPLYGLGLAETRLGRFLRGVPRADFTVSTKVGRLIVSGAPPPDRRVAGWERDLWVDTPPGVEPLEDYRADAFERSLDESLGRLGLDRVDFVQIHVPDSHLREALDGGFPALARLREQGVIGAIGVGAGNLGVLEHFVREADLDCILLAGSWTILDQTAALALLPLCLERCVAVIMGSVLAGGLLVDAPSTASEMSGDATLAPRIARIRALCTEARIPVVAAALQFPLRHPAVTSVLVGARATDEVEQDIRAFGLEIPAEFWAALEIGLVPGSRAPAGLTDDRGP